MKTLRVYTSTNTALLFVALNVADVLTTWLAIRAGGQEGNPIMTSFGVDTVPAIAIWKTVGCLTLLFVFARLRILHWLKFVNIVLAIVCALNVISLTIRG